MGVQKERKSTFLTAFEQQEKEARSLLLHNIDIAVVTECLCHLRAQYPILSPDICIGQQNLRIDRGGARGVPGGPLHPKNFA